MPYKSHLHQTPGLVWIGSWHIDVLLLASAPWKHSSHLPTSATLPSSPFLSSPFSVAVILRVGGDGCLCTDYTILMSSLPSTPNTLRDRSFLYFAYLLHSKPAADRFTKPRRAASASWWWGKWRTVDTALKETRWVWRNRPNKGRQKTGRAAGTTVRWDAIISPTMHLFSAMFLLVMLAGMPSEVRTPACVETAPRKSYCSGNCVYILWENIKWRRRFYNICNHLEERKSWCFVSLGAL